jgi:ABC-type proline/glycine betaine transport system substrate-binding protein
MMTNEKLAELQKQGQEYVEAAKALVEEHGEDLSSWAPSVRAQYDEHTKAAGAILEQIRTAKDDLV